MSLKHKDYKEANIRFLEENLEKEGVMELPCGIQYKILLKGTGPVPTAKNTVKVHYRGTLIDGKVFDDSFARKRPEIFKVGMVKILMLASTVPIATISAHSTSTRVLE